MEPTSINIEKPVKLSFVDSRWFYRILEIVPGLTTWTVIIAPIILSISYPIIVAYFIIAYDLLWLVKSMRMSIFLIRGYRRMRLAAKVNWSKKLDNLKDLDNTYNKYRGELLKLEKENPYVKKLLVFKLKKRYFQDKYHKIKAELAEIETLFDHRNTLINPDEIYNVVILATYNESLDTLKPSVEALTKANWNPKKLIFVLAYEERGGEQTQKNAKALEEEFKGKFGGYLSVMHPRNIPGEIRGKGSNITFAGRQLLKYIDSKNIPHDRVIVTTLDSDHRVSPHYFDYLTYVYAIDPNRNHKSFQPIAMFFNNIWDAPAPMRVIAAGNSFWLIIETMRPHRLRNFAAHAQGLQTLVDTDFWSVTTIVEDGHQFWRTYFVYDGDHQVKPIYAPIFQDAILSNTYLKTFKNQYLQLRRWAWGISDFPFVVKNSIKNRQISFGNKFVQTFRLFEGHLSWATTPLILTFVAWLPLIINSSFKNQVLAHQLPVVASWILTVAMAGLFVTIWISMISLPPRPTRYKRTKSVFMLLQWLLLPITTMAFGSFAAIDSQTRLMLGKYLEYWVTEKAQKK
ncbi:MAG: hypothetical protein Q8P54_00035 [bacterium]|nr:hypothetical protein [bacterium]